MAEEIAAHITGTVWKIEVEVGEEFTAVFEVLLKSVLRTGAALDSPKAGILKGSLTLSER